MQVSHQIKYQIVTSRFPKAQGNIENIKSLILNKKFELYSDGDNELNVEMRLEAPSIVTKIEMRLIGTYMYELILIDGRNNVVETFSDILRDNKQGRVTLKTLTTELIRYAKLKIENHPTVKKRLGIIYISFQGINEQTAKRAENKKSSKLLNSSKLETNKNQGTTSEKKPNLKKDSRSIESKQIFKSREKEKSNKPKIGQPIDFSEFELMLSAQRQQYLNKKNQEKSTEKPKKKVKPNQQDNFFEKSKKSYQKYKDQLKQDTDLAIALSKSQQQKMDVEFQNMDIQHLIPHQDPEIEEEKPLPPELENYFEQNYVERPSRRYQIVQFSEQYISNFSDFSPKWLEAQRKAEEQYQVRQEEKLSKYVRLKHLSGVEIFIEGFEEWRVDELRHQAKMLGCKIIDHVQNHCIAIVSKALCEKLKKKHKQWKQVKYLRPEYLQDCIKYQERLNPKGYYVLV